MNLRVREASERRRVRVARGPRHERGTAWADDERGVGWWKAGREGAVSAIRGLT